MAVSPHRYPHFVDDSVAAPTPSRADRLHHHKATESVLSGPARLPMTSAPALLPSPIPRHTHDFFGIATPQLSATPAVAALGAGAGSGVGAGAGLGGRTSPFGAMRSASMASLHTAQHAYQESVARAAARMDRTAAMLADYRQAAMHTAEAAARAPSPSLIETLSMTHNAGSGSRGSSLHPEMRSLDKARADLAAAMAYRTARPSSRSSSRSPPKSTSRYMVPSPLSRVSSPGSPSPGPPAAPQLSPRRHSPQHLSPQHMHGGAPHYHQLQHNRADVVAPTPTVPPPAAAVSGDPKDATIAFLRRQLEEERARVRQVLDLSEELLAEAITEQEDLVLSQEEYINRLLSDVARYREEVAAERKKLRIAVKKLARVTKGAKQG